MFLLLPVSSMRPTSLLIGIGFWAFPFVSHLQKQIDYPCLVFIYLPQGLRYFGLSPNI
jgi:hypothetical protein